jgi:hypothetical protein
VSAKHPLALAERARLWLSYQRYGILLVLIATLVAAAGGALLLGGELRLRAQLGVAVLAVLIALPALRSGLHILARWPRKLRATLVADRRIASGRFRPESIRGYCEDPCYRVVAAEILRRAGLPASERHQLVARFTRQAREPLVLLSLHNGAVDLRGRLIDHDASIDNAPTHTETQP